MSDFKNSLAYKASAGSGKTYMLVVRYLSLLFLGANPSKILALTFTNKAAGEMRERIVNTLENLENKNELKDIANVSGLSEDKILKNKPRILEEFLNTNPKIITIDKFLSQILRKFSLYVSLMPDFTSSSLGHSSKLLLRFLKEVDIVNKMDDFISLALESQKRLGDIFVLLDIFYTKKYELENFSFSRQEVAIYEQEALSELAKLREIVEKNKLASSVARNGVKADNFDELCKKSWLDRDSFDYSTFKKVYIPEMDIHLQNIKDAMQKQFNARENNLFFLLNEFTDIYDKSKKALYKEDSELSFNDVSILVHRLLKNSINRDFLYFRLDSKIEHILLDEFQDTSILQYEILKPLISEIISGDGSSSERSFFLVGDVKQSIYRFRGGVCALFAQAVEENNAYVEQLLVNYRSQKEVVVFVNNTFRDKIKDYEDQLFLDKSDGGYVEVVQSSEPEQGVFKIIKNLLEIGINENDIAILCATNDNAESVKNRLLLDNIAVVTETNAKLINQKNVQALIEYLKYLYFKEDIYKENFFTLIGQKSKNINFVDFSRLQLIDIVKKAIDEFELFQGDSHQLRFLDTISKFLDIESFIFRYERLDISSASEDLSGVRVLTVHRSKGLEYKNVVVMDRLTRKQSPTDMIIYDYESTKLQNIYFRIAGRDKVDGVYKSALEKDKELAKEDSLNAMYVAFTRAEQNLFVVKKEKDSMFDVLELEVGAWGELKNIESKNIKQKNKNIKEIFEYKDIFYGTQGDILSLEKFNISDYKSINFGLAMHYMLEMMSEFKKSSIEDAKDMMINKYGYILEKSEIQKIQKRVNQLIHNKEFLTLIEGECFKEQALRYKKNLRYIDLLVKTQNHSWNIIDYKSSELEKSHHIKQVEYYIDAVKEITQASVSGYICYLLENEIKIVKI